MLWNHLIFDGAYHETNTDGFIHGTSGRSGSYYGGLTWIDNKFQIRYKNIGNFEKTGQAWNGVTAGDNDMSLMDGTYGINTGIKTYEDMWNAGLGKYNSLYEYLTGYEKDANGNYPTARYQMADGSYWNKTTDNFWQNHNILSAAYDINDNWSISGSLHYTHGYGYYNEFRYNNKLSKFGLPTITVDDEKVKRSDFVRKKGLKQDTYGLVWNANYKNRNWDIIGGLSLQNFTGNHFGYLTYSSNPFVRQYLIWLTYPEINGAAELEPNYKYYDSDARKFDGNAYLKAAYRLTPQWEIFADVQYRHVSYKTDGYNDKFIDNGDGTYSKHYLDINEKYHFFNPKAGFAWHNDGHRVYGSVAMSHREPERNNFTDNGHYPAPKAERVTDYELGYQFTTAKWHVGANAYWMDYTDQFVQTGQVSDIGESLTTNIKSSYRLGLELTASWMATNWLTVEGNAALSANKIKDFDEFVEDWDLGVRQFHYDHSTLAFSPSTILNSFLHFHHRNFQATWHTNFVSRQYLDNTENHDRSLPAFSRSDLNLNYTIPVKNDGWGIRSMVFGLNFGNIFNAHYAASGWVYSAIAESYGHTPDNRYYQIGFIPMSGFTAMGSLTLKF